MAPLTYVSTRSLTGRKKSISWGYSISPRSYFKNGSLYLDLSHLLDYMCTANFQDFCFLIYSAFIFGYCWGHCSFYRIIFLRLVSVGHNLDASHVLREQLFHKNWLLNEKKLTLSAWTKKLGGRTFLQQRPLNLSSSAHQLCKINLFRK